MTISELHPTLREAVAATIVCRKLGFPFEEMALERSQDMFMVSLPRLCFAIEVGPLGELANLTEAQFHGRWLEAGKAWDMDTDKARLQAYQASICLQNVDKFTKAFRAAGLVPPITADA